MAEFNILYGGISELNQVKESLTQSVSLQGQLEQISEEKKQLEMKIETLSEQMKNKSQQMVESRRAELASGFDKDIQKENIKLREIRNKRERALKKGIENRISQETALLRDENKRIKGEIKEAFKQDRVPRFCNSTLFYGLFMPKGIREIFIFVMAILLFGIGAPVLLWNVVEEKWFFKFLTVFFYFAVLGVTYFLIFAYTKDKHQQTLEERRPDRQQFLDNKREINKITRSIKKDKNEKQYNLTSFDKDIYKIQERIQAIGENKKKALNEFEGNTVSKIVEEATKEQRSEIEELKKQEEEKSSHILALENQQSQLSARIASEYTAYLGAAYMTIDKIDQLINMISSGQAGTIQEGIDILSHQEQ